MSLGMIVGLAVVVIVVSLVVSAGILRLCGRLLSFPRATWKRSLLTAVL